MNSNGLTREISPITSMLHCYQLQLGHLSSLQSHSIRVSSFFRPTLSPGPGLPRKRQKEIRPQGPPESALPQWLKTTPSYTHLLGDSRRGVNAASHLLAGRNKNLIIHGLVSLAPTLNTRVGAGRKDLSWHVS